MLVRYDAQLNYSSRKEFANRNLLSFGESRQVAVERLLLQWQDIVAQSVFLTSHCDVKYLSVLRLQHGTETVFTGEL